MTVQAQQGNDPTETQTTPQGDIGTPQDTPTTPMLSLEEALTEISKLQIRNKEMDV
jgi:hypothetical protein